jgi:acetyl esterase/lipase/nucleoside-diphosphate-sugar epimerase
MKVVVIGGTGLIGSKLVANLRDQGHEAVAAAPNTGVNTLTGEGLADVLQGASVVVDVSNSPSFEPAAVLEFFETSTRNLLEAEATAGVGHHVALSIVGTDRSPDNGYFVAKVAQEKLIETSSIPYSIVRATQFFEFVNGIADSATTGDTVRIAPVGFQPIAADDVAAALGRVATAAPINGRVEIAGPHLFRFDELVRHALSLRCDPRVVVTDPEARYFGGHVTDRSLVPDDGAAQLGAIRFDDWLEQSLTTPYALEPAARAIADATAKPPLIYQLGVDGARKVLDDLQAAPVDMPDVDEKWIMVAASVGDVRVRIVKPVGAGRVLPAILYVHGGGWILGNAGTHDRLVRELAVGANAAVVFVEYDRSPEVQYPVAIEQAYATARWITTEGWSEDLDGTRLAVAGDSVGGNMAAALAILAKQRGDVRFVHQSLYYPVTDAAQDSASYREFANGPYLTAKAMAWFWDAYLPDTTRRDEITASPLRATLSELSGLPDAFVIVDQNDVLRDEGEAYARKLTAAGVRTASVRVNNTLHDFMMLNPLRVTAAASAAVEQAIHVLRVALGTS